MTESSKKFVQFGCWNQGLCGETNPLTLVTNRLKQYTLEENPEFIVVAGDNYYPNKVKNKVTGEKTKTIIPANLTSGFDCLPNNVDIDIILGNHDLEPDVPIKDSGDDECYIIKKEMVIAQEKNINLVLHKARNLGKTLLLLIDTTMYDTKKVGEFLPCYQKILDVDELTVEKLHEMQWDFIRDQVNNFSGENIIVVGHHPITGYKKKEIKETKEKKEKKEKKGKEMSEGTSEAMSEAMSEATSEATSEAMSEAMTEGKKKKDGEKEKKEEISLIKAFNTFTKVLSEMYKIKSEAKYYYLCADLHLYQKGIVRIPVDSDFMTIEQYIVGSGGTELDPNPIDENFTIEQANLKQSFAIHDGQNGRYILLESLQSFGFLVCDFSDELKFTFIDVTRGGRRTKRRSQRKSGRNKRKSQRKSQRKSKRKRRRSFRKLV